MTDTNTQGGRTTGSSPSLVSLNRQRQRVFLNDPSAHWKDAVIKKLNELVSLERSWDGYGAQPVSFEVANFTLRMLEAVCPPSGPCPSIVPGISSDLQVEWHLDGVDIELHVERPNVVKAWHLSRETGPDGETYDLTVDFVIVSNWIKDIAGQSVANRYAAA